MRISDWSSDVCSSDLCKGAVGNSIDQDRRGGTALADFWCAICKHAIRVGAEVGVTRVQIGDVRAACEPIHRSQQGFYLEHVDFHGRTVRLAFPPPACTHLRYSDLSSEARREGKECGTT